MELEDMIEEICERVVKRHLELTPKTAKMMIGDSVYKEEPIDSVLGAYCVYPLHLRNGRMVKLVFTPVNAERSEWRLVEIEEMVKRM